MNSADNEQLDRIELKLNSLAAALKEPLGFLDTIARRYITVLEVRPEAGSTHSVYFWHFWDKESQTRIPIFQNVIRGFLTGLDFSESTFKGKTIPHLTILLDCGGNRYGIQSRLDSLFSRSALLALSQVEDFNSPITLEVRAGTEKNALFSSIFSGGKYVPNSWEKNAPAIPAAPQMETINSKLGYTQKQRISPEAISPEAIKFIGIFEGYAAACDTPDKLVKLSAWCGRNQPAGVEEQVSSGLAEIARVLAEMPF